MRGVLLSRWQSLTLVGIVMWMTIKACVTKSPTTPIPTTLSPTTEPTTKSPTSLSPTPQPTTDNPTSQSPTRPPTTPIPTTLAPSASPTPPVPTTVAPSFSPTVDTGFKTDYCFPRPGLDEQGCRQRIATCGPLGIDMKWSSRACLKPDGTRWGDGVRDMCFDHFFCFFEKRQLTLLYRFILISFTLIRVADAVDTAVTTARRRVPRTKSASGRTTRAM